MPSIVEQAETLLIGTDPMNIGTRRKGKPDIAEPASEKQLP